MKRLEAANKALTLLGVSPITSFDLDVQAARVMKGLFQSVERAVLCEFPWSFALRLTPLTAVPVDVAVRPVGWEFAFLYPPRAVSLYQVYIGNMIKTHYIVQNGLIWLNVASASVEYTVEIDFEDWPGLVAEALTARLASDAASALAGSPQLASMLLDKYGVLVAIAHRNSLNEENVQQKKASHYLDVR